MQPVVPPVGFCVLLFLGMLAMIEFGRRIGLRRRSKGSTEEGGLGNIEGAMFALFGLMIAFTFSGAATRFNEKRMLVAEEANTIEVAYLRLQLLPEDTRGPLQALFRDYVDSRIETYHRLPDIKSAEEEMRETKKIREAIWAAAVSATGSPAAHVDAGKLTLPAINEMIDIMTIRTMSLHMHPPKIIYLLLFGLGILCSMLAGYRMSAGKDRSWLHILTFVTVTVSIVFVILDVEYPRWGLIRIQGADQVLVDVRESMH